jgi:hypothetical protein
MPVEPVDPVAPVGPAGPAGPGATTLGAGTITVFFSHAVKVKATSTAENTIEYFMKIPLVY